MFCCKIVAPPAAPDTFHLPDMPILYEETDRSVGNTNDVVTQELNDIILTHEQYDESPRWEAKKKSKSGFKKGAKAVGKALKLTKSSKKVDKAEKSPKGKS